MAEKRPDRTLGPNHDTFWDWCNKGELRLQRCEACNAFEWPVVKACHNCGGESFRWERMSGRGSVVSWCTFERDYYYGILPIPWDTIVVELEEGPYFVSNPKGFSWRETEVGMPVRLTFTQCEDAAGTYQSPVFEKA